MLAPLLRLEEALSVRRRKVDLPALLELLAPGRDIRLLDLGGGTGAVAAVLARDFARVVVVEPNPRKVAFGRARHTDVEFVEGRGERIPASDRSFERIVALLSFHHMDDQDRVLDEMRRVLTASGHAVLQEFYPASGSGRFARIVVGAGHGGHHRFHEPAALEEALKVHGFHTVSIHPAARSYFVRAGT